MPWYRPFLIALSIFFLLTLTAAAQESATESIPKQETATASGAETAVTGDPVEGRRDSNLTRNDFQRLVERHPPQVARVLKLDPTLFSNESYLSTYPELAKFLEQHPEVEHNPTFYLEGLVPAWDQPEEASTRIWRNMMEGISIFAVMLTFLSAAMWLVRTLIDHRRWSRTAKVQAEVHGKLMDRFATSEELLAYIQSPGGRKFLESAPITVEAAPRAASAPVSRMLWSIQVGLVLMAAGGGLEYVAGTIDKDIAGPMSAMGVLGIAIGTGFVLSAFVSFFLSWKLGLWTPRSSDTMAE